MRNGFVFTARLTFLLVLMMGAPVFAQGADIPVQTDGTIEVGDTVQTDQEIRVRISNLLREIDGFDRVEIEVSEGVVTATGAVLDRSRQDQLTSIITRIAGVVAFEDNTEISGSLEERLTPAVERITDRSKNLLANAPIFFVALASFLVVAVGGWLITKKIWFWDRIAPNSFIADVYRAIARIVFILIGLVLALDILNATALIGAVLGAAGVVGLAVGFAVRDTVENFIASILLSLRQPFRPNDIIEIDGDVGTVARLTSRATILISLNGNHIRIPNATVFKGRIVNYTRDPRRRFEFVLGVDADADLAEALSIATESMSQLPFILNEPDVGAWVSEVGDSNVLLTFTGWVDQTSTSFLKARGEAIRTVKTALESSGFGLPEPIYRVRLDGKMPDVSSVPTGEVERAAKSADATDLPGAASPSRVDNASSHAAERERDANDTEENLLNVEQKVE